MVNEIDDSPNVYNFGKNFSYIAWTPGTNVTLINVPWNNDYRDIVDFGTRVNLNTYLDSLEVTGILINSVSYLKPNIPVRLEIPFNAAYRYNYIRASNPIQPIGNDVTKDYYYFITDVRYLAPSTTEFVVQLDIWQTFGYDIVFGNSYVERGHIGIANQNNFNNYGRDYLTIPEGLDYGSEYQIVDKYNQQVMGVDQTSLRAEDHTSFLVVSTTSLQALPGDVTNPILTAADGGSIQSIPSGASYYLFPSIFSLHNFMLDRVNAPWVTQGIVSITAVPNMQRYDSTFTYGPISPNMYGGVKLDYNYLFLPLKYPMMTNWRNSAKISNQLGSRYSGLKKFWTFPYMLCEVTTFNGNPIVCKPDSWNDPDATIVERVNYVPPNQRIMFSPYKYNAVENAPTNSFYNQNNFSANSDQFLGDDNGEWLDLSTAITDFPSLPIVNDGSISYLAANAHGISFQNQSAEWSQNRALMGNSTSYDQASSAMNLASQLSQNNQKMASQQADLNNSTAAAQTAQGQLSTGAHSAINAITNPMGALGSIGGGVVDMVISQGNLGIQQNQTNQNFSITNAARQQAASQSNSQSGYIRDTNKSLSDYAAKGDYANTIAGLNAKVQDARLIQPSMSGQFGGQAFNIVNNAAIVSFRIKMIDKANIRIIGEYWLRYGYSVRQFYKISKLSVMSKFTYWKLSELYITNAPMPEPIKQAIRGIFEKGVTVWNNPVDIGNTDLADNTPIPGFVI